MVVFHCFCCFHWSHFSNQKMRSINFYANYLFNQANNIYSFSPCINVYKCAALQMYIQMCVCLCRCACVRCKQAFSVKCSFTVFKHRATCVFVTSKHVLTFPCASLKFDCIFHSLYSFWIIRSLLDDLNSLSKYTASRIRKKYIKWYFRIAK